MTIQINLKFQNAESKLFIKWAGQRALTDSIKAFMQRNFAFACKPHTSLLATSSACSMTLSTASFCISGG